METNIPEAIVFMNLDAEIMIATRLQVPKHLRLSIFFVSRKSAVFYQDEMRMIDISLSRSNDCNTRNVVCCAGGEI